jgi:hypothetical protein
MKSQNCSTANSYFRQATHAVCPAFPRTAGMAARTLLRSTAVFLLFISSASAQELAIGVGADGVEEKAVQLGNPDTTHGPTAATASATGSESAEPPLKLTVPSSDSGYVYYTYMCVALGSH